MKDGKLVSTNVPLYYSEQDLYALAKKEAAIKVSNEMKLVENPQKYLFKEK